MAWSTADSHNAKAAGRTLRMLNLQRIGEGQR